MKTTELSEFLEIKEQYDAETELVKQLEKKPLSNAQIIDMLTRGLDNEQSARQLKKFKRKSIKHIRKIMLNGQKKKRKLHEK